MQLVQFPLQSSLAFGMKMSDKQIYITYCAASEKLAKDNQYKEKLE